jgi:hypothetical protein
VDSYEKNIKEIQDRLDEILGFGKALKSFAKGMVGDPYTDEDKNKSGVEVGKDYKRHVQGSGSAEQRKALAGKPAMYKIGNNYAKEVENDLIPYLSFEVDEAESQKKGVLVHTSNVEKVLKNRPSIEWLFKGVWEAKVLGLTKRAQEGRGSLKGRLITFIGAWESGAFMGVLRGGAITGGQMIDGYYLSGAEGFKIKPWDFKSGGFSVASGFAMGLRLAKDNAQYKKLSLIQVQKGQIIKIIDNNDKEHLLKVEKGVDYTSANMKINGTDISWENYNRSGQDFANSIILAGKPFSIPGVINIDKGVQSIEVKSSEYEGSAEASVEGGETVEKQENWNRFDIDTNKAGWKPNVINGYKLDIEENNSEAIKNIQKFKDDINSGKFFRYVNFFKQLVEEGRIDGYGNYPNLAFLFPKEIGKSYKNDDVERNNTMKYFSDFRKDVINNFRSEKISQYYLKLLKREMTGDEVATATGETPTPKKKRTRATGRNLEESKLSLTQAIKKVIQD